MAQNLNLSITPGKPRPRVYLSQYDVGRSIKFYLKEDGTDYSPGSGYTVKMEATKPSGLGFSVTGTLSDSTATFTSIATMTNEYGDFPAELKISNGTELIGTANFIMSIEKSPHPDGTTDGDAETVIPELTLLVRRAETASQNAISASETATAKASEASESASQAATSASGASDSASAASTSATNANASALKAEGYAVGKQNGEDVESGEYFENNAKYYAELARETIDSKADIDGSYADLHAGTANQILSDTYTTDEEPYHYRQTPSHAGTREIEQIVGGSVVWNQLYNRPYNVSQNGITCTRNNDGKTITMNGTATSNCYFVLPEVPLTQINHIYLSLANHMNTNVVFYNDSAGINLQGKTSTIQKANAEKHLIIRVASGTVLENFVVWHQCFDLTALFANNPAIADHIYQLEQANAGAGVAFFKKYFGDDYHPFDEGTMRSVEGLVSHDMVGFNQWDEEWELGAINSSTGQKTSTTDRIRSKNYIPVIGGLDYFIKSYGVCVCYDDDKNFIESVSYTTVPTVGYILHVPSGTKYIMFAMPATYGTTYNHDICINISDTAKNGQYEPYEKHSYPLDNSVTLRGIPQLVDGKIKWDGDTYSADGVVTRRYGIVDLGTLNWNYVGGSWDAFVATINEKKNGATNIMCEKYSKSIVYETDVDKIYYGNDYNKSIYIRDNSFNNDATAFKTAMSGVYLIHEFATPTTEQADPYQELQICSPYGTEEYVSTSIVPVGHYTKYPTDLKSIVEQIADAPSADGTYTLKATVSGGKVTYSWESANG